MIMSRLASRFDAALLILSVGFGFSLAANLLWTWPGGVVRILGGALASIALPGAIHLWEKIPLPPPLEIPIAYGFTLKLPVMRAVRAATMTGIALMAAYTTFSHASELLIAHGEREDLATLYPILTELLVVMGVLARKTKNVAVRSSQKQRARRDEESPAVPVTKPALHEVGKPPSMRSQVRAWLVAELDAGRAPSGADADNQFGLTGSSRCGANVLKKVLEDRDRRAV